MDIKKIITDAHMAGQTNQGVDASWSEAHAYYTEFIKTNEVGNVAKPNACPQLADVQTDGVCFICKKPTQNLSPDPTNWRIDLPFNGGNGLTRQYHQGCIVALIDKHFG